MLNRAGRGERGATAVEYALIAGLIAIVVAAGAIFLGPAVSGSLETAGAAVEGAQTTEGTDGLCAGVFVSAPVTCDPGLGVSFTACANGITGDGSAAAPWACAPAPADLCAGVFTTAPVACSAGVIDSSQCTNGLTGDGSAGAPWACAPAPVGRAPYSGPTPTSSYSVDLGSSGSYALPAIPGIQYAKGSCTNDVRGGCGGGQISISGTTLSTGSGWGSKAATQTITWTIPETDTTLAASGSFTVNVS